MTVGTLQVAGKQRLRVRLGLAGVAGAGVVLTMPSGASLLVAMLLWLGLALGVQRRVERLDGPRAAQAVGWLALAKIGATIGAYGVFTALYGGGDAGFYDHSGRTIAQAWASGAPAITEYPFPGTGTIEYLTGALYVVVEPATVAAYLIFSAAGFAGAYLWYRAVRLGAPDLEPRRLAILMLGMPTVLFWTSTISKDATVMLGLGAAALGSAQLLNRRARGVVPLALGLGLTLLVRPHLAAMFAAALGVATLAGRSQGGRSASIGTKVVVGLLAAGAAVVAIRWLESYSTLANGQSASEIQRSVQSFGRSSGTGGSAFEAKPATSPAGVPFAVLTVVFRPSLLDVRNPLMLIAALESTYLLIYGFVGPTFARLLEWRRARHPLFLLGTTFVVLFAVAFSNFANYGYLARQRAQIMPILAAMTLLLRRPNPKSTEACSPIEAARFTATGNPSHTKMARRR